MLHSVPYRYDGLAVCKDMDAWVSTSSARVLGCMFLAAKLPVGYCSAQAPAGVAAAFHLSAEYALRESMLLIIK